MNVVTRFKEEIENKLDRLAGTGLVPAGLDTGAVTVEPPRDPAHGDIATNAALVLAAQAKCRPRQLAEHLATALETLPAVATVQVAGPGFINLTLKPAFWHDRLRDILTQQARFGGSTLGAGTKVNVEYVSANPTGPLHVGHCRGAVFGDALANLLEAAGFQVLREYYINDAGGQVDILARSAYLRYREALGEAIDRIPEGLYPGDYLRPVGAALARHHGRALCDWPESDWLPVVRQTTIDAMMDQVRVDLAALGIHQDVFFSERSLHQTGKVDKALETLDKAGHIYVGVLDRPKGHTGNDWKPRPQTLFRATAFGDDVDRALKKSDQTWTYFAADIAYHLDKFERGYGTMIDVWGADHGGYVKRMKSAVVALTGGQGALDVKICQLVRLFRQGEPVRMSKRAGSFVTLRDIVDEVGKDVVRFMMLFRKNDATLDFDFSKVTEQSKENPVFYVQYAHARACSVLRHARDLWPDRELSSSTLVTANLALLTDRDEVALIKKLAGYPRLIETAAEAHEPHRLAFYLHELAAVFHGLWNKGNDEAQLRFIIPKDFDVTMARLGLVQAVATVIRSGLDILGVDAVEEMR